jgi:hypothetical protein
MTCCFSGLHQAGLGEAIGQSINLLPEDLHGTFWVNIGLIGGSTILPVSSRVCCTPVSPLPALMRSTLMTHRTAGLRPHAPADCEIIIYEPDKCLASMCSDIVLQFSASSTQATTDYRIFVPEPQSFAPNSPLARRGARVYARPLTILFSRCQSPA